MGKIAFKKKDLNLVLNGLGILLLLGTFFYAPNVWVLLLISAFPGFALYLQFFHHKERRILEAFVISVILTTFVFIVVQALNVFSVPLPPIVLYSLFFFLPLVLIGINYKKLLSKFRKDTLRQNPDLFFASLIVVISLLYFGVFIDGNTLPQEDGPLLSYLGLKLKNELIQQNTIYHWNEDFYTGSPQIPLESAVTYYRMGISSYLNPFNSDYYKDIANLQLLFALICILSAYLAIREAQISSFVAFSGILLLFITPYLSDATHANIRLIFPAAFLPMLLFFMISILNGKNNFALLALTAFASIYHHVLYGLGAFIFLLLFLVIYSALNFRKLKSNLLDKDTFSLSKSVVPLFLFAVLAVGLIAFYFYNLQFLPQEISTGFSYSADTINYGKNIYTAFRITLTVWLYSSPFLMFGVLGILLYLLFGPFGKRHPEKHRTLKHLLLLVTSYILLYNLVFVKSSTLSGISLERRVFYLVFVVTVIGILYFIDTIGKLQKLIAASALSLFCLFTLFSTSIPFFVETVAKPLSGDHRNALPIEFDQYMDPSDNSRFSLYCLNYFAKAPEILMRSGLNTMENSIGEMEPMIAWRLKFMREGGSNRILPRLDHPFFYWKNFMRITNTRYAVINFCACPYNMAEFLLNNYTSLAYDSQCMGIVEADKGGFSEKIELSYPVDGIYDGLDYSISKTEDNPIYNLEAGYKHHFPMRIDDFDKDDMIRIAEEKDLGAVPEPIELVSEKLSDEEYLIRGDFRDDEFVLVKNNYFPMWHAYMGGEELEVFESNTGLTLIKTNSGDTIRFVYEYSGLNKLLYLFFVLSFIGICLLFKRFNRGFGFLLFDKKE